MREIIEALQPTKQGNVRLYTKTQLEIAMGVYSEKQNKDLQKQINKLESALKKIRDWELPESGKFWDGEKTEPMSYEAAYGSNGARDFIRNVAQEALAESEYYDNI